jgi:hypothetical protein
VQFLLLSIAASPSPHQQHQQQLKHAPSLFTTGQWLQLLCLLHCPGSTCCSVLQLRTTVECLLFCCKPFLQAKKQHQLQHDRHADHVEAITS